MSRDQRIVELEIKLEELKHQYDNYLSGQRRTEPTALKAEVERNVLLLTRFPSSSTMFKFQVKTLAMRYRAMETQVRNILDLRQSRLACSAKADSQQPLKDIVIDELAIDNPAILAAKVKALLQEAGKSSNIPAGMTPDSLCAMMVSKARSMIGKNNVKAIRYSLVTGEQGTRVKGELISGQDAEAG